MTEPVVGPLKGLEVIEISGTGTAGLAGKYFADWGARVTILEPRSGTPLRQAPPYYETDGERRSGLWAWLSRGKVSCRVDEAGPLTPAVARDLCMRADVLLVESELCKAVLGLEPAEVRPYFEGRNTCVLISPFATDGPYSSYAATDLGLAALGGWMNTIWLGEPDREPIRPGVDMTYRYGGLFAFVAALIGLHHARHGGEPQFIDLSLQAVATHGLVSPWLVDRILGVKQVRSGARWPSGTVRCRDGWVACSPLTTTHWEMVCHLMGLEDILARPDGLSVTYRMTHADELAARVQPWFLERTRHEIFHEAQAWRIPSAPVESVSERLEDPQLAARGFWQQASVDGRTVKVPRVPNLLRDVRPVEREPLEEAQRPPAGLLAREPRQRAARDVPPRRPLEGLRVLDLTWFWAGPFATMLLGALGADVIKIESIQRPDPYRYSLAPEGADHLWERSPYWLDTNYNKRGLTLDLNSPTGRALFERLAQHADVVISNFSNRVMPNLGLTAERLLEINPRLIVVTMPGYGPGGPWEDYVGYGVSFEQLSVAYFTGYPDRPPMIMGGICDPIAGLHAVMSVALALRYREQANRGTVAEVPQSETLDSLFAPEHIAVQHGAPNPERRANRHEWMAPHNVYRVAGDDEWISIAVATDQEFAALARELGLPQLAQDARFATGAARKEHEEELDRIIGAAVKDADLATLERRLQTAGVKACRVSKAWNMPDDEGLRYLGFWAYLDRQYVGKLPQKGWPFWFSSIDASHRCPPPLLGQDNREILTGILGLTPEEVSRLEDDGVIGTVPVGASW